MNTTVETELVVFGASIAFGAVCGLLFDAFRGLRQRFKSSGGAVAFQDMIFWIILSALFFALIYKVNYGQPRFYIFLGAFAGLILYMLTLSRFFIFFFSLFIAGICKVTSFVFNIIAFPVHIVIIPLGKINKKIGVLLSKTKKLFKKTKKQLKMY